ncbi:PilZ domain-containing protein [uncultured Rhodoblastus sp.]|uniref:PilZ domain-containing protein n=1 Tax=uncultured Rhodoblastus sp. TaxID=543037 RepID=UPI0025F19F4E|nr:PilZ domain-containing protein [uncultured Rhodoblastus sp.]
MRHHAKLKLIPLERRRYARVKLALLGRYMLEDRREFPCQTIDISVGGLALTAPVRGVVGERIIAYFDALGRIEGHVVRHFEHGFAMTAAMHAAKREKMVNQLTWLANRNALDLPEDRRHERIVPNQVETTIRLPDGGAFTARIVDISVSGAAIACENKAPVGALLHIGRRPARVVRCLDHGMALEFALPLSYDVFDANVVL